VKTVWVDANVLLRFLTDQPRELARRAQRLMSRAAEGEVVLVVPVVVLAEVIWVLRSPYYGYKPARIASELQDLVAGDGISMEGGDDVLEALALMTEHNVDFADAYLAAVAARRSEPVATFDADFRRLGVELLSI
jgi:predicted nucleic acid-binding protein